jgi:hypothetical protein
LDSFVPIVQQAGQSVVLGRRPLKKCLCKTASKYNAIADENSEPGFFDFKRQESDFLLARLSSSVEVKQDSGTGIATLSMNRYFLCLTSNLK